MIVQQFFKALRGPDKRVRTSKAVDIIRVRYHFNGMYERLHLESFFTKNDSIER